MIGNPQLFVLVSLAVITLLIIWLAARFRKVLLPMQGMIISMFFGMSVSLTVGVLFGVAYHGNLFHSTMIAIGIGVLAGSLCGVWFGLLAILEGFMAGMMGGMMGAMLGAMINVEQSGMLIQLLLLMTVSTIFIILLLKTPRHATITTKRWLLKPVLLGLIVLAYAIGSDVFIW
ncbi:hypothetical protein [Sporosarcina sp. OR05]|uniref:hypothetical protein n=1 Tax=Sporosarcina sp. OR05 TaxID=2969819 RepID=UPI003529E6E4